jgi:hypothetical protein
VFLDELGVLEVLLGEVGRHLGDDEAGDGEPREEGPVALPLPVEEDRPQPTDRQTYASASTCATITKFGGHLPHASNQAWARLIRNGKWRKNKIKQQELHWLLIGLGYTHSTDTYCPTYSKFAKLLNKSDTMHIHISHVSMQHMLIKRNN